MREISVGEEFETSRKKSSLKISKTRQSQTCCHDARKKSTKEKTLLTELFVKGNFTELEETQRSTDKILVKKYTTDGDRHFKVAEITHRLGTPGKRQVGRRESQWTRGFHCE